MSFTTLLYFKFKSYGVFIIEHSINYILHTCPRQLLFDETHLLFLTEWYTLGWRFKPESRSARQDLLFDINIGSGPKGVFNLIVTNSGKGAIDKLTSDFDSGARITLKTIKKIQKFDYE